MQYHHHSNGLWVFFFVCLFVCLSIFYCVIIMCRHYCLFSILNVLFSGLKSTTLACPFYFFFFFSFLQGYCITVHITVIWFVFGCLFLKCCLHMVLVQKSCSQSCGKQKKNQRKINSTFLIYWLQPGLLKNMFIYFLLICFGRHISSAWVMVPDNIIPV